MSDFICEPSYYPGSKDFLAGKTGKTTYYYGKEELGKDDPQKQECRQAEAKPKKAPSGSLQRLAAWAKSKISWTGKSQGAAGCGEDFGGVKCPSSSDPNYPAYDEGLGADPRRITDSQLKKGVEISWPVPDAEVPIFSNCDKSIDNLFIKCDFNDGESAVFYPDDKTKKPEIKHFFKEDVPANFTNRKLECYVHAYNPDTGKMIPEDPNEISQFKFKLHKPYVDPDPAVTTTDQCKQDAKPFGTVEVVSSSGTGKTITYGSEITVKVMATDCDGDNEGQNLTAVLIPNAGMELPMTDGGLLASGYRLFNITIKATDLANPLVVRITDNDRNTSFDAQYWGLTIIDAPSADKPSAVISSDLAYSYKVNETATNICVHTDAKNPKTVWTVTRPDKKTIDTFTTQCIPSYTFHAQGDYEFKVEVTTADGTAKNTATRKVGVYPATTDLPSVGFTYQSDHNYMARRPIALSAGFKEPVPGGNYTYEWTITDLATTQSSTLVGSTKVASFTPMQQGNYEVAVTIKGDGLPATGVSSKAQIIQVYEFSKPNLVISGENDPKSGTTQSYAFLLVPYNRPPDIEDTLANCDVKLYKDKISSSNVVATSSGKLCSQGFDYTFSDLTKSVYILEVTAHGYDNSYTTSPTYQAITVWPPSAGPTPTVDVAVNYDPNGSHAFRPVTFTANTTIADDPKNPFTYTWEILDQYGNVLSPAPGYTTNPSNPVSTFTGNPASYTFTANPSQNNVYTVRVTVSGGTLANPITKTLSVPVYGFTKPGANINFNEPIYAGQETTIILGLDKNRPEDQAAQVSWEITYKENGTTKTALAKTSPLAISAGGDTLKFTPPLATTYTVKAYVEGKNGSTTVYTLEESSLVTAYSSSVTPKCDFNSSAGSDGPIPYRDITFNANCSVAPAQGSYTYNYEVTHKDGVALPAPISFSGNPATHQFTEDGVYTVKLTVSNGGLAQPIVKTDLLKIYEFPKPEVTIFAPAAIYANQSTSLSAILNRSWAEDNAADVSWKIEQVNPPLVVLDPTDPNAKESTISFTFPKATAYKITTYVKGMNGTTQVYSTEKTKSVIVYSNISAPSVSIQGPLKGVLGQSVNFQVPNPDTANYDYSWYFGDENFGDPATPGTNVNHTYIKTGNLNVKVMAKLKSDPSVKYENSYTIFIGTPYVPMPVITATHTPASGPGSGYNINFDASGSYSTAPNTTIVSYTLIFGDGQSATNSNGIFGIHTYPNPGPGNNASYSAYLFITDSNGLTNEIYIPVTIWGD